MGDGTIELVDLKSNSTTVLRHRGKEDMANDTTLNPTYHSLRSVATDWEVDRIRRQQRHIYHPLRRHHFRISHSCCIQRRYLTF